MAQAQFFARARLAPHVHRGAGIVADQEHAEARPQAAGGEGGHARSQLLADLSGGGGAVEDAGGHGAR